MSVRELYTSTQLLNVLVVNRFSPLPGNLSAYSFNHLIASTGPAPDRPSLRMQDPSVCQSEGALGANTYVGP